MCRAPLLSMLVLTLSACAHFPGAGGNSFPELPPEVAARLSADFDARVAALEAKGVPQSIDELKMWYPKPPDGQNAAAVYRRAADANDPFEQYQMLEEASRMPFYRYPEEWEEVLNKWSVYGDHYTDYNDHLRVMCEFGRALRTESLNAIQRDDTHTTTATLVTGFRMLRHFDNEPFILSLLTNSTIRGLVLGPLGEAFSSLQFDEEQLRRLDEAIASGQDIYTWPRFYYSEKAIYREEDSFTNETATVFLRVEAIDFARTRRARVAIAVERYRLAESRLPQTLDELVPSYLEEVPLNPFTGHALSYAVQEKGYVVYTVGPGEELGPSYLEEVPLNPFPCIALSYAFYPKGYVVATVLPGEDGFSEALIVKR